MHAFHQGAGGRGARSHHISVHITASSQRRGQSLTDASHQWIQATFHNSVKLKTLTRGDPERVIGVSARQPIEDKIQIRRYHPARNAPSDHEDELLGDLSRIAIILLINSVKFKELGIVL